MSTREFRDHVEKWKCPTSPTALCETLCTLPVELDVQRVVLTSQTPVRRGENPFWGGSSSLTNSSPPAPIPLVVWPPARCDFRCVMSLNSYPPSQAWAQAQPPSARAAERAGVMAAGSFSPGSSFRWESGGLSLGFRRNLGGGFRASWEGPGGPTGPESDKPTPVITRVTSGTWRLALGIRGLSREGLVSPTPSPTSVAENSPLVHGQERERETAGLGCGGRRCFIW